MSTQGHLVYGSANPAVLARVPGGVRRVLDVGCGDGTLGAELRRRGVPEVWGITHSAAEAARARTVLTGVFESDLGTWRASDFPADDPGFDLIVCSHVLEHLAEPGRLLQELRRVLQPDGILVVALPNVLHWRQRLEFLRGRFRYTRGGLMDATHLRFFDVVTARALLEEHGWRVDGFGADGTFPGSRFLGPVGRWLDRMGLRLAPGMLGFQFVMSGRPTPESPPVP